MQADQLGRPGGRFTRHEMTVAALACPRKSRVRSAVVKLFRGIRTSAGALSRWPLALAACCVLALVVLVPGLGRSGLWEQQERQLADRVSPPAALAVVEAEPPPPPKDGCVRIPPKDAAARTLTARALAFGRDSISDDDFGRRLPLAILALFTVLAAAGIAMRAINARAGVITALVLLSMPLLVLQGRMVTSEIGTACGATSIIFGLLAFARPTRSPSLPLVLLDKLVALASLFFGLVVGFYGGGALLGVAVPVGAFAAAGAFGIPLVIAATRRERITPHLPALVAALGAATVLGLLAYQLYELKDPYPGISPPARSMFGRAIVPEGCWSWALGATWRPEDDLRFIFDSAFEQIAFGTYPWGIVAPIAMVALLGDPDPARRHVGALALAWAAAAWIATEAFHRKVGFTIWAGFPALAIAIGAWLESLLARRHAIARDTTPADATSRLGMSIAGALLVGLFVLLAVLDFGKDIQTFAEKLTSLLTGTDVVTYPKDVTFLGLKLKLWVLVLGMIVALGFGLSLMLWRPGARAHRLRWLAHVAIAVAFAGSVLLGAFWAFVWQPRLATYLSSKTMLETVLERRAPTDPLVIMGDLGHAPKHYAPELLPETAANRAEVVAALKRPQRVFAIAPRTELCPLHREQGDKPYFVLEERNLRNLLFSNVLDPGHTDQNPLASAILHKEPQGIQHRPKGKVVWDNRIELLGWNMPASVKRGDTFEVTLFFKILNQVNGNWKSIMHFDGSARFLGDHDPIKGICPTSTWTKGDYIVDRVEVVAGGSTYSPGRYELWIGFFTGTAPNFRNMTLTEAPGDIRDTTDRVKLAAIQLEGGGCSTTGSETSALVLLVLGFVLARRRGAGLKISR